MANLIFRKNGTNYTIDGLIAGTGHIIKNSSGQEVNARQYLQFNGVYVSDDAVGDKTEVNIVRQMTKAAMQALSSAEQEGFIDTTDEDDDYIPIAAEDVKRGVSDVDADLTALENGKVNRSGDTMTGKLHVPSGSIASGDGDAVNGDAVYSYIASGKSNRDEHNANNALKNGVYYYTSNGPATASGYTDGALYVQQYSDAWCAQIAQDYRDGRLYARGKNNGTWQSWQRVVLFSDPVFAPTTFTNTSFTPTVGGTKTLYTNSTGHSQIVYCSVIVVVSGLTALISLKKNTNATLAYSSWSESSSSTKHVVTLTAFANLANGDTIGFDTASGVTFGTCTVSLAY